jgi:hypothetical protein
MPTPVAPVVYSIQVSGQTVQDWPKDAELRQSWGNHDLFFLRIPVNYSRANKNRLAAWADNAPIQIIWGRGSANMSTWYGYVNHHEVVTEADGGGTTQITYVCIGSSKPMNTEVSRAWPSTTPTIIAQTIARKYKLRCIVTSTNFQLPFEMQVESDFSFLNRIASKAGFRFWVSGGTMYFIDPAVCLSGLSSLSAPHYNINQAPGRKDTAKDFRRIKGDNIPGAVVTQRQISGVDQSTGQPFTALADTSMPGTTTTFNTSRHVTSYQQAKQIINAQQNLSQFWISATVEVFGYTLLYPGKVIYLGGSALPDGATGYWIVTDAQHVLAPSGTANVSKDFYITRLSIMTNSTGGLPNIKGTVQVNPEQVPCILVGKSTWQSTNFSVVTDGVVSV